MLSRNDRNGSQSELSMLFSESTSISGGSLSSLSSSTIRSYNLAPSRARSPTLSDFTERTDHTSSRRSQPKKGILKRRTTSFFKKDVQPVLNNNEVHIELKARGLSHWSPLKTDEGGTTHELINISGVVKDCSNQVSTVQEDDKVFGFCHAGELFSDYAVTSEFNLTILPKNISFEEGAVIATNYVTAWTALIRDLNIQSGDTILVRNAAVDVGLAATQIAQSLGAEVVCTSSTDTGLSFLSQTLGIDRVYNHTLQQKYLNEVILPIDGVKFQLDNCDARKRIIDTRSMSQRGVIACTKQPHQSSSAVISDFGILIDKQLTIMGANMTRLGASEIHQILGNIAKHLQRGLFKPYVTKVYTPEDVKNILERNMSVKRNNAGNSVINYDAQLMTF